MFDNQLGLARFELELDTVETRSTKLDKLSTFKARPDRSPGSLVRLVSPAR
jgi:hypothetical protein